MQDLMYDKLRELATNVNAESIDQLFNNPVKEPHWDDDEEEQFYRSQLEPKYVIVHKNYRYEFRARYTDMHRSMLSSDEIMRGLCDGGGFWGVDGEKKLVTLYDSSSDFGRPKHIEEAIKQDGRHLLEILGKVCDKSGEEHDLSDYQISYIDAIGHRHYVEPREEGDIMNTEEIRQAYAQQGIDARFTIKRPTNYTASTMSKDAKKKKKAKRRAQKQARRKR